MADLAYLQLTRVCDQRCVFCSNPATGSVMPPAEALRWLENFSAEGYTGVVLTGGEPALHPALSEIIARAAELGLTPRLITNGRRAARPGFLARLKAAGLRHIHVSLYSHLPETAAALTGVADSLTRAERCLEETGRLGLACDMNTVLCRSNAGHLADLVAWTLQRHPHVRHFVFNNMDPEMSPSAGQAEKASLREIELGLGRALALLAAAGRSFRVERVPLCYLPGHEHCSTETRRLARGERRAVKFLDPRGLVVQRGLERYGKAARCASCSLDGLCAGAYGPGRHYSTDELCPVFVDAEGVRRRALA